MLPVREEAGEAEDKAEQRQEGEDKMTDAVKSLLKALAYALEEGELDAGEVAAVLRMLTDSDEKDE